MSETKKDANQKNSKYLFGFSLVSEIGPARFEKIRQSFRSIKQAWQATENEFSKLFGEKIGAKIQEEKNKINLEKEFLDFQKEELEIITPEFKFNDFKGLNFNLFPDKLKQIPSSPYILFAKGDIDLLSQNQLAIVGSRRPTYYGKQVLEKLGPEIALSGLIITSGLAMGIDTLAHRSALNSQKPTIAVLGSGLGQKILKSNFNYRLGTEIIEKNGLLISEYPPNCKANKFSFPARNRIISGLSLGILIVEAAERSGTLITARHALDQNREILVIPGNIFSQQSIGTNKLIKQGAEPITSVNDIFQALNWKTLSQETKKQSASIKITDPDEKIIYNKLSFDPQPLDKIIAKSNLDISEISIKLSIMELKGLVKNVSGGYIRN